MVFAKNTMFFCIFPQNWGQKRREVGDAGEKRKFGGTHGPAKQKKYSDFTALDTAER